MKEMKTCSGMIKNLTVYVLVEVKKKIINKLFFQNAEFLFRRTASFIILFILIIL